MVLKAVERRWHDEKHTCIVAAPGPSLTAEVARRCRGLPTVAIKESWQLFPWADVLYACDAKFWNKYNGCPGFAGDRWSTHDDANNKKLDEASKYGINLVRGQQAEGFSLDPKVVHYGSNSGFQGINLALLLGGRRLILVGFDMHDRNGRYFFSATGPHTQPYDRFVPFFERAAKALPVGIEIVNATPGSALRCFPMVSLDEACALR